jgi:hypothetical protein
MVFFFFFFFSSSSSSSSSLFLFAKSDVSERLAKLGKG